MGNDCQHSRVVSVIFVVGLLALTAAGAYAELPGPGGLGGVRRAVIVGINNYTHPAIPDLQYAEADAIAVYNRLLVDPLWGNAADIDLFLGAAATRANVRAAIQARVAEVVAGGSGGLFLFYFSGNGTRVWTGDPINQDPPPIGEPLTSPWDECYAMVNCNPDPLVWDQGKIRDDRLQAWLNPLDGAGCHYLTIADCGYEAGLAKGTVLEAEGVGEVGASAEPAESGGEVGELDLGDVPNERGVCLEATDPEDETGFATENPLLGHGEFTYWLLQGATGLADNQGGNNNGLISAEELHNYILPQVNQAWIKDTFNLGDGLLDFLTYGDNYGLSRPDALIRTEPAWAAAGPWVGNDIYAPPTQSTPNQNVPCGVAYRYRVRIQNDGLLQDRLRCWGSPAPAGWTVRYTEAGGADITAAMTSWNGAGNPPAGGYFPPSDFPSPNPGWRSPGSFFDIFVEVTPGPPPQPPSASATVVVGVKSYVDPGQVDRVSCTTVSLGGGDVLTFGDFQNGLILGATPVPCDGWYFLCNPPGAAVYIDTTILLGSVATGSFVLYDPDYWFWLNGAPPGPQTFLVVPTRNSLSFYWNRMNPLSPLQSLVQRSQIGSTMAAGNYSSVSNQTIFSPGGTLPGRHELFHRFNGPLGMQIIRGTQPF